MPLRLPFWGAHDLDGMYHERGSIQRILEPFGEPHPATDHSFGRVPHNEDFDRYEIEAFVSSLYEFDPRVSW